MMKETCQKSTTNTTPITPEFTDTRLTNYAGLVPFPDLLLDKLDFGQILAEHLDLGMGANCQYKDWQVFGLIIYGYLCGHRRLIHFEQLSGDTTVQKLLGLDGPIDENTVAYRLKQAGYKQSVPGEPDTEYCTFTHTCAGWDRPRQFIGIRILQEEITEGLLFPQRHYQYGCAG